MRGMRDWDEWITKEVGVIRVNCYTSVTLLEHGRMRLRAQDVNKGGGSHFSKQHAGRMEPQWASRVALGTSAKYTSCGVSPQGILASAQWEPACCSQGFPLPDLLPALWPPSP